MNLKMLTSFAFISVVVAGVAGCAVEHQGADEAAQQQGNVTCATDAFTVTETGGKSQVVVQDKTGAPDKSTTSEKMLTLLLNQLK